MPSRITGDLSLDPVRGPAAVGGPAINPLPGGELVEDPAALDGPASLLPPPARLLVVSAACEGPVEGLVPPDRLVGCRIFESPVGDPTKVPKGSECLEDLAAGSARRGGGFEGRAALEGPAAIP
jgi:hypothetical protein